MKRTDAFVNSLRLPNIALLISGISIYPTECKASVKFLINCVFYSNFLWLYTDVLGEFYWLIEGIIVGKSVSQLTFLAPLITFCLLATAKSASLYYNRQLLVKVINKLREMHPDSKNNQEDNTVNSDDKNLTKSVGNDNENKRKNKIIRTWESFETPESRENHRKETERQIVEASMKFQKKTVIFLFCLACLVTASFSFRALITMIIQYYTTGKTNLKLPFIQKYFFNPFTKSRWPFLYLHQVMSTVIASSNICAADSLHYVLCSYIEMHFRLLSHQFEHMVSASQRETRERLIKLAKRHQDLIVLVDEINIIYSKSTLFHMMTGSILICLCGFNIMILEDRGSVISFSSFLSTNFVRIYLLCLFGDKVKRSSMEVSEAAYKCRWNDADTNTKKSLLIIMTRARNPCKLTAFKFADLNLNTFSAIMSTSWTYFTFLRTMYK